MRKTSQKHCILSYWQTSMSKIRNYIITVAISTVGALLFQFAHIPMPWLLGPLFTTMLLRLITPMPIVWHTHFKDIGLVLAGYSIGIAFTVDAFHEMGRFLPLMVCMNIFYVILFLVISQFIVLRTKVDKLSALTSTVPGGMSQILAYASEKGSQHITMITFYQVLRVLCILSFVPLIVSTNAPVSTAQSVPYNGTLLLFLLLAYGAGFVGAKLRIPTGYMLGPVLLFIVLQLANVSIPPLPASALHIAQLLIGIFIGMLLKKEGLHLSKKVMLYGFISALLYIGTAYIISFFIVDLYGIDFKTAFLSTIPGGLDQMGLIAASVKADVTIVTAFQLFRVLVVTIFIVPGLKYFTKSH